MKVAIVNDSHWGVKSESMILNNYICNFYRNTFFPYLKQHNITHIIHAGDVFDRRKFINFNILKSFRENFMQPIMDNGYTLDVIVGNHDTFLRNTNEINSPTEIIRYYDKCTIYENSCEVVLDGTKILYIPWICKDNYAKTLDDIKTTQAIYSVGHLELAGFEILKGITHDEGMGKDIFRKFDKVLSGHYHHKSDDGTIFYLGTQYELTWSDYNDKKGFHIFDTSTGDLEFIQNPESLFHKIIYDDTDESKIKKMKLEKYKGTYLKVIIENKKNPALFDKFLDKLYAIEPADFSIIEDTSLEVVEDIEVENYEDTLTVVEKYVELLDNDGDVKDSLKILMKNLYIEAITD